MKRKILIPIFIVITAFFGVMLFACSQSSYDEETLGKYYKITADGAFDTLKWLELKENGRFSDETKLSGSFSIRHEVITLTATGEKTLEGTIKNGEIKLTSGEIYCKEGVTPSVIGEKKNTFFTVSFDTDGGSAIEPLSVKSGLRIAEVAAPVKEGYVFYGWYKDGSYSEEWNFKTDAVESDVTLYARMVAEQGKIDSLKYNETEATTDGENILLLLSKNASSSLNLSSCVTLNRSDAVWKLYSDAKAQQEIADKTVSIEDGNNFFYIKTSSSDGLQTYSYVLNVHKKHNVDILCFFDKESEKALRTFSATTYEPLDEFELNNITVDGYEIEGWQDKYGNAVALGENGTVFTERTLLYAVATPNEYEISYNANNGTTSKETDKVYFNTDFALEVPYLEGYSFVGWKIDDKFVTDKNGKSLAPYSFLFDNEAEAVWNIDSYSVFVEGDDDVICSFDPDNVGSGEVIYDLNCDDGYMSVPSDKLAYHTPERQGYVFAGWFLSPDCKGVPYAFNETVVRKTVLYAKWVSVGDATPIYAGMKTSVTATADSENDDVFYAFYPLTDDSTSITNPGAFLAKTYLYDGKKALLASANDNRRLDYSFESNKLYFLRFVGEFSKGTAEIEINGTQTPTVSGKIVNEKVKYSDTVTVTASQRSSPYIWLGWYKGDTKVSDGNEYSYTFDMPAQDVFLTPKWAKISASPSFEEAGQIIVPTRNFVSGDKITVTAKTNSVWFYDTEVSAQKKYAYVWVGWFDGEEKISADAEYTFVASDKNVDLTAKWVKLSVDNSVISAEEETVADPEIENALVSGNDFSVSADQYPGYTFVGWYNDGKKVSSDGEYTYSFTLPETDMTLTARRCKVTVLNSDDALGTVSIDEISEKSHCSGDNVTITAKGFNGSVWQGWYINNKKIDVEGDDKFAYAFAMPSENLTIVAKWSKITIEKSVDGGSATVPEGVFLAGDTISATATVRESALSEKGFLGFAWVGWFGGETKLSSELEYSFEAPTTDLTLKAVWTYVKVEPNVPNGGNDIEVSNSTLSLDDTVTITAKNKDGYSFLGFFEGDKSVASTTLTVTIETAPRAFVARWAPDETISITANIAYGGEIFSSVNEDKKELTLSAIVYPDCGWLGWYVGESKISEGKNLSVTLPAPSAKTIYTAKFVKCETHVFGDDCVCSVCGLTVHDEIDCYCSRCGKGLHTEQSDGYCLHGNSIYMGFYPQTRVDDEILIAYLDYASSSSDLDGWTAFDFYKKDENDDDYAFYKDIVAGAYKYRGVYFKHYRPSVNDKYDYIASASNQDENGYFENTVYWFKYEPVKWNLLATDENFGLSVILPELILDCGNLSEQSLNAWCTKNFAPVAFDGREASVFGEDLYPYVATLPVDEATNKTYGFNTDPQQQDEKRVKSGTDYAKSLGLYVSATSGSSYWIIGDLSGDKQTVAHPNGSITEKGNLDADCGFVPVLLIKSVE